MQARARRFAFYTLLPESEVLISADSESAVTGTSQASTCHKRPPLCYYRRDHFGIPGDAEHRRAELLLLGFDAHVNTVQIANGQTLGIVFKWVHLTLGPNSPTPENGWQTSASRSLLVSARP